MGDFTYQGYDNAALDVQYNARASVASFDDEYARLVEVSKRVMKDFEHQAGIVYDPASGETLDFYPAGEGAPLFVWIHGGYWRGGNAADNAFSVPGLHSHGFSVAVIDYTLAPAVTLDEIVRQIRTAISFLHRNRGRLKIGADSFVVGGTSAGGHLTAMLLADGWQNTFGVPQDIVAIGLDLSGLHDLAPLLHTHINAWMNFDDAMVARNSPQFLIPQTSPAHLIASVGGLETKEFCRQTTAYAAAWRQAGHAATVVDMPDHNHFDLPLTLREPDGKLVRAIVEAYAIDREGSRK
ncbi:arylformamidase [Mesorhizobium soli]|uniref:alpha/beta hydrolase n=1 Tax=Pseudaminobacter soli (ex Li et al. 2025) TaxID=1295366 RepID=UPI0024753D9B|nr:alpha/beta hydrolase [Mesorhizobium soli]MDH6231642.1 arylformamidase [Mesorhizobium soli]